MSLPPFMPDPAAVIAYRDAIEADVREQVAAEIEAEADKFRLLSEKAHDEDDIGLVIHFRTLIDCCIDAARVARGGGA